MRSVQKRHLQISAVIAAALTVIAVIRWNDSGTEPTIVAMTRTRSVLIPTSTPTPATISHESVATHDPTLSEQVDSLLATHDPAKAFGAYILIRDCAVFNRDHERIIFDLAVKDGVPLRGMTDSEKQHDAKLCSGMTERMRVARIDYLAIAAAAGISGAIVNMASEGPFGDPSALVTRPDDPLVKEWRTRVIDQLVAKAEGGDLLILNAQWPRELSGDTLIQQNPALAYRYAVAIGLIDRDINGPNSSFAKMYAADGQLMLSIEGLSDDDRRAELAAAQRIADRAKEHRQQGTKKL